MTSVLFAIKSRYDDYSDENGKYEAYYNWARHKFTRFCGSCLTDNMNDCQWPRFVNTAYIVKFHLEAKAQAMVCYTKELNKEIN